MSEAEGRTLVLEYDTFYLVSVYVPNIQDRWTRLEYRVFEWDVYLRNYCKALLDTGK